MIARFTLIVLLLVLTVATNIICVILLPDDHIRAITGTNGLISNTAIVASALAIVYIASNLPTYVGVAGYHFNQLRRSTTLQLQGLVAEITAASRQVQGISGQVVNGANQAIAQVVASPTFQKQVTDGLGSAIGGLLGTQGGAGPKKGLSELAAAALGTLRSASTPT